MVDPKNLKELEPEPAGVGFSATHVQVGVPIPKVSRVRLMSEDTWEEFVEEWATSLEGYVAVRKSSGPGDKGLDVVGFKTTPTFQGGWDCYQCKRYDHPIRPSDIWIEIGKLIYHCYSNVFPPPDVYNFVGPYNVGPSLGLLLGSPEKLRAQLALNWDKYCTHDITSTQVLTLDGPLKGYFDEFDFGIFGTISVADLIMGHGKTTFHSVRFGGGLPSRPPIVTPSVIDAAESRYLDQLFEAYTDSKNEALVSLEDLSPYPSLARHFHRQRERFYSAEALRNFARDNVPEGTFDKLKDDAYDAVIDTCESDYPCGLTRMKETLDKAGATSFSSSPLFQSVDEKDKRGLCHHLANEDRLTWVPKE